MPAFLHYHSIKQRAHFETGKSCLYWHSCGETCSLHDMNMQYAVPDLIAASFFCEGRAQYLLGT
jgi:hypothetical protein